MSESEVIEHLREELAAAREELDRHRTWVPAGHVLSPIPSTDYVREHEREIYAVPRTLPAIDLNESHQLQLFESLLKFYSSQPFPVHKTTGARYWFENPAYSYADAILLYCMMRYLQPRRIVEVGSGYSSSAILDTNERFFKNSIACTFIEPNSELLQSLLKPGDAGQVDLVAKNVQDVETGYFTALKANDILFIDSTHVAKTGSDVNHIFFRVLPALNSGVYIHFHDIFYPFEYPRDWVYEGRAWNEAYLLRAFLQYNSQFQIQLMNTFIDWFHKEKYFRDMPLVQKNTGGSIWIKKV